MMKKVLLSLFLLFSLTYAQGKGMLTVKKVARNAVRIQYQECPEAQAIITNCLKERESMLPYIQQCAKRVEIGRASCRERV